MLRATALVAAFATFSSASAQEFASGPFDLGYAEGIQVADDFAFGAGDPLSYLAIGSLAGMLFPEQSTGAIFAWTIGTGTIGYAAGHAFASVGTDPSLDLMRTADRDPDHQDGFRQGYRTRLTERKKERAGLNALLMAGGYAVGALLRRMATEEEQPRGWVGVAASISVP